MQANRRFFLRHGAFAVAGTAPSPSFLVRSVLADAALRRDAGSLSISNAAPRRAQMLSFLSREDYYACAPHRHSGNNSRPDDFRLSPIHDAFGAL